MVKSKEKEAKLKDIASDFKKFHMITISGEYRHLTEWKKIFVHAIIG